MAFHALRQRDASAGARGTRKVRFAFRRNVVEKAFVIAHETRREGNGPTAVQHAFDIGPVGAHPHGLRVPEAVRRRLRVDAGERRGAANDFRTRRVADERARRHALEAFWQHELLRVGECLKHELFAVARVKAAFVGGEGRVARIHVEGDVVCAHGRRLRVELLRLDDLNAARDENVVHGQWREGIAADVRNGVRRHHEAHADAVHEACAESAACKAHDRDAVNGLRQDDDKVFDLLA